MSLISTLMEFFKKPPDETRDKTPDGLCPICWGYYEYDGTLRKVFEDRQIDVSNHRDSYMLIQDFVVKYIDGIRLKKAEYSTCPTCGTIHEEDKIRDKEGRIPGSTRPLKRHGELQPLSREHHHGLLLSWKIREGLKQKVDPYRIKKYTDWFWENHLQHHFAFEERYTFSILGDADPRVKRAKREHRRLKRLFTSTDRVRINLSLLEEELVAHIRFEERVLFNEIQKVASLDQLELMETSHQQLLDPESWKDEFWVKEGR